MKHNKGGNSGQKYIFELAIAVSKCGEGPWLVPICLVVIDSLWDVTGVAACKTIKSHHLELLELQLHLSDARWLRVWALVPQMSARSSVLCYADHTHTLPPLQVQGKLVKLRGSLLGRCAL